MISIITIVRNQEQYIEETIKSVIIQSVPDLEYIIIDGASSDGTLEIINKYKDKISIIISEKDNGIYDAINKGIKLAKYPLIGLLNSSDVYVPGILKKVVELFYDHPVDVMYGDIMFKEEELNEEFISIGIANHHALKHSMSIFHPSTFISKNTYKNFGTYNLLYESASDYDYLLRLYLNNLQFQYLPEIVTIFRKGGKSGSANFYLNLKENFQIRLRNLGFFQAYLFLLSHVSSYIYFNLRRKIIISLFGYNIFLKIKKTYQKNHDKSC